jgi:hypothetical protein
MLRAIRVDAGSALGEALGFTAKLFSGWIEIYEDNKLDREIIYLQYINSNFPRKGNVKRLIASWVSMGFRVRIVRPGNEMRILIEQMGFIPRIEMLAGSVPIGVPADVWRLVSDTGG